NLDEGSQEAPQNQPISGNFLGKTFKFSFIFKTFNQFDYIIFFSFSKTLSASNISSNQVRLNFGVI
ncbi:hypothetical protein, partial [Streptococcus pneumoniae]|uniref:hypothetical protein n=2 Tax=Streptococcus pneumoniae TaxID=1313 RepID=UPI001C4DE57A